MWRRACFCFFFHVTATPEIYTLSLHDALPISGILAGWLAFAIFIPLAITSNEWSVRRLRRWWKRIHRWIYAAALLVFAHWLLVAFDVVPGLIHLLVLGALEGYRIWKTRTSQ